MDAGTARSWLPPDDRVRSPRTGWTRSHWLAVADHLLAAVVPWRSPLGGGFRLPGRPGRAGRDCDGLEGFARTFVLAAFRIAAAVAIALHECRPWLWDLLDDRARTMVVGGLAGTPTPDNNWQLFRVVGEQFLASVGEPYSVDDIDSGLDRLEDWYRGEGWYTDGGGQKFDYYANFVMHPFPVLWSRIAAATPGADSEPRLARYRERLRWFLEDAGHLEDASSLSPGRTRRLCSGTLRHFVEHGASDERGLLSLGWYDEHVPTVQPYSGPGSPYWSSFGFLGLLLDADHPVWTDHEDALPQDTTDVVRAMPMPGFLVHSTVRDGLVRMLNHGSDHLPPIVDGEQEPAGDPHYDRLAFSSRTGPDLPLGDDTQETDNCLILVAADGTESHRGHIRRLKITDRRAGSWFRAVVPGVPGGPWRVETVSVAHGFIEIRTCLVEGTQGLTVRMGGYALADTVPPDAEENRGGGQPWALINRPDGLTSAVVGLHGYSGSGVQRRAGANAFGPRSATPCLYAPHSGEPMVLVCAVALSGYAVQAHELAASVAVTVHGRWVQLSWADGRSEEVVLGG